MGGDKKMEKQPNRIIPNALFPTTVLKTENYGDDDDTSAIERDKVCVSSARTWYS